MFCKYCGKEIDDNADVCIHCGRKTREDVQVKNNPKPLVVEEVHKEQKIAFISLCVLSLIATFIMPTLAFYNMRYPEEDFSLFHPWASIIKFIVFGIAAGAAVCLGLNKKTAGIVMYSLFMVFAFYCRFSTDYWVIMPAANMLLLILLITEGSLFVDKIFKNADEQKRRIIMISLIGAGIILCLVGFIAPKNLTLGVVA